MRILVISGAYPPMHAGESANAHHLCRHLAARELDVHVLTAIGNTGANDTGITVHPVMKNWSWLEGLRLARFVKRCAPDAVLLMYLDGIYKYHPMVTFAPTIAKWQVPNVQFVTRYESPVGGASPRSTLGARIGRKVVAAMLGGTGLSYSWGTLLRDSDGLIALCEDHRNRLGDEWPGARDKTIVIPPPPNVLVCPNTADSRRKGRARLSIGADEFVIVFFGYVYPKKGIETLLHAFNIVRRTRNRGRLVLIGGTIDIDVDVSERYWEQMQELCRELDIAGTTTWTGAFKSDEEKASLYLRAADIAVLPLLNGIQLNNSSFSAMAAHGVPIITTRGPMTDAVFVDGENVLMCEPGNAVTLANKINALMDSASLRERLRSGVTKLAGEWFSWDKGIARTMEALLGATKWRESV